MLKQHGLLRVWVERGGTVQEITEFLNAFKSAHDSLYALDIVILRAEKLTESSEDGSVVLGHDNRENLNTVLDPSTVVFPHERLYVSSVVIQSPGFWEFLGILNPLQQIREYLNDRHQRRKDRDYREKEENEKLRLENERLRFELLRDKVEYLRSLGAPEPELRRLINRLAFEPLDRLDSFQDRGMIIDAETEEAVDDAELVSA